MKGTLLTILFCLALVSMITFSSSLIGCSGDDDDDDTAPTATATPTPTQEATATFTPTATPGVGWTGESVVVQAGGDWIDVASNQNGELSLCYFKEGVKLAYVTRDQNKVWSSEREVAGSHNNVFWDRSFNKTSIDNNGDVHFVWINEDWESIFYNRFDAASQSFVYPNATEVIWGYEFIIHPDIVTIPTETKRFVSSQVIWGAGFNWDLGSGWNSSVSLPYWNEPVGECKTPRMSLAPNGKIYMVIYDYFWHDGKDQIGFNEFDPQTMTWSGWTAPAPMPGDVYPGWPALSTAADGSVHIAWYNWRQGGEFDQLVYVTRDSNGNWQTPDYLVSGTTLMEESHREYFPCVGANQDGVVLVVWATRRYDEAKIYYSVKKPGQSWSAPAHVSSTEEQHYPSMTVVGNTFIMIYLSKNQDGTYSLVQNEYNPE